jgi:hypothetical protein
MDKHYYTKEEIQFLAANVTCISCQELTDRFNSKFGVSLGVNQIRAAKKNRHLSSGFDGRFNKGRIPANKGIKTGKPGINVFEKGHVPSNIRTVGTEIVKGDGYLWVKIADPNKWRQKHRIMWEEKNGPIPRGSCLLFGDGDRLNVKLDNLILITRTQLSIINQKNLIRDDVDSTRSGLIIADVYHQIAVKTQKLKKKARS